MKRVSESGRAHTPATSQPSQPRQRRDVGGREQAPPQGTVPLDPRPRSAASSMEIRPVRSRTPPQHARPTTGPVAAPAFEPVAPAVKHGLWKKVFAPLLGENPAWRTLKDAMAQASLSAKWQAFLRNEDLAAAAERALQPFVAAQDDPFLARKAADYAHHKQQQSQTVEHHREGRAGAKFIAKRTNLPEDIHRTREGTVYTEIQELTPAHQEMLARQTDLQPPVFHSPQLGAGAHGRVALAQTLGPDGRPNSIVALKANFKAERTVGRNQAEKMRTLPPSQQLMRMRESYVGYDVVHQLSELAAGGTASGLMRRLSNSKLPDGRKRAVACSILYQVFDTLATLHQASRNHGDVKLSNVLIAPEGGASTRVILHDVGQGGSERKDRRQLVRLIRDLAQTFGVGLPQDVCNQLVAELRANRSLLDIMDHPYFHGRLSDEALTAELAGLMPRR